MSRVIQNEPGASSIADVFELAQKYFDPTRMRRFAVRKFFQIQNPGAFSEFDFKN